MFEKNNFHQEIEQKKEIFFNKDEFLKFSPKEIAEFVRKFDSEDNACAFLAEVLHDHSVIAVLSYWEKWLDEEFRKKMDEMVDGKQKREVGFENNTDKLPLDLDKRFNEEDLELIFSNLVALQLTFGCSKKCSLCGFDAVPGIVRQMPFNEINNLFKKYGHLIGANQPYLYWASEPYDYKDFSSSGNKSYKDVHELVAKFSNYVPHITSREFDDEEWTNFIANNTKNPRLSLYNLSESKKNSIKSEHNEKLGFLEGSHDTGIGRSYLKKKKGESLKKSEHKTVGLGCADGVLITPRGIYNIVLMSDINDKFPQGQIVIPLEKVDDDDIKIGYDLRDILLGSIVQAKKIDHNVDSFERSDWSESETQKIKEIVIFKKTKIFKILINQEGIVLNSTIITEKELVKKQWT